MTPLLVASSASVPYSQMARHQDITKLHNFVRDFGYPSLFYNSGIDAANGTLSLVMNFVM